MDWSSLVSSNLAENWFMLITNSEKNNLKRLFLKECNNHSSGTCVGSDYATDGIDHTACQHDTDETHYELIVFDQLFGGGDKGVYGLSAYDGVTVIYNNK